MKGWIKLHRRLLTNPIIMKDSDHLALWTYILLKATHDKVDVIFNKKRITLKSGEFTTGRKTISKDLSINESKVQRILKCFESEQQIEQRTDRQCRLIKVLKWDSYQDSEQRNEQQMNNDRTTSEQRVNTKQEGKNVKNVISIATKKFIPPTIEESKQYFIDKKSNSREGEKFFYFYESKDWKVGKNKMKSWEMSASGWISRNDTTEQSQTPKIRLT